MAIWGYTWGRIYMTWEILLENYTSPLQMTFDTLQTLNVYKLLPAFYSMLTVRTYQTLGSYVLNIQQIKQNIHHGETPCLAFPPCCQQNKPCGWRSICPQEQYTQTLYMIITNNSSTQLWPLQKTLIDTTRHVAGITSSHHAYTGMSWCVHKIYHTVGIL